MDSVPFQVLFYGMDTGRDESFRNVSVYIETHSDI